MQDNTARMVATLGVWSALAVILTWGVFGIAWDGTSVYILPVIVAVICWSAAGATASIWEWKPKRDPSDAPADIPRSVP